MEPFITFKEKDADGKDQFFVLQRKFPHYQAIVLDQPKEGALVTVPVSGHHLYLTFAGTIQGNYLLSKLDVERELQDVFEKMAEWFYVKMVSADPKKYKRFKI